MAEDQPDLFTYEPPPQDPALPPMRHGPGKAVHPEVRRQREAYIEAALERGETLVQIARAAGVAVDTVKRWRDKTHFSTKFENRFDKERKCLSCLEMFWSEGPHNRMCADCRLKKGTNPYEPGAHGTAGRQRQRL